MVERHTLLVVDDEPDVVQSLHDLLRREYRVLCAIGAREGLRMLHEQPIHVVMTDQRMPEISGIDFLRSARRDRPEAIRLLFTGYADIKAVIDAINEGNVYRYINKPFEFCRRGLGLGLSVVQALFVAMHGGAVEVDSTPGKGTAFTIALPTDRLH